MWQIPVKVGRDSCSTKKSNTCFSAVEKHFKSKNYYYSGPDVYVYRFTLEILHICAVNNYPKNEIPSPNR